MLLTSSRCAHSLFLQPQGSRSTSDPGNSPGKAAGSQNSMLEKKRYDEKGQKPTQPGRELGQIGCRHFVISLTHLQGTQEPEWMGMLSCKQPCFLMSF